MAPPNSEAHRRPARSLNWRLLRQPPGRKPCFTVSLGPPTAYTPRRPWPSVRGGSWTETVLYAFVYQGNPTQDVIPNGEVLIGPRGGLYATTQGAGEGFGSGTVIALVPPAMPGGDWTEDKLYTFGFNSGYLPLAGVVSEGGSLFGTNFFGGG
jgi:hypothetical protein